MTDPGARRTIRVAMDDAPPVITAITAEYAALRKSHPHAPPLDVLDAVMEGKHDRRIGYEFAFPPHPFALIVAEALDFMTPDNWVSYTNPKADEKQRTTMRAVWMCDVWPKFLKRYRLA